MSLVFNMVGGGSGGISDANAVLVARVPSGSTVTATKDGVTLTPTMWVSETYPNQDIAMFVFSSSQFDSTTPWTITATDGTQTASGTILITTNREYEISVAFPIVLVANGIPQVSIANNVSYANPNALLTVTQGSGYTRLNAKTGWSSVWSTTNKINVAGLSTMTIEFVATNLTSSPTSDALRGAGIGVMAETFKGDGSTGVSTRLAEKIISYAHTLTSSSSRQTVTLDISAFLSMYLVVMCSAYGSTNSQADVYNWRVD